MLDMMMQAFSKMGNIPFPAGQFREPAFYVEVEGGNAVNLRLYQNYRSYMPGMEDAKFHAVCPSEKQGENEENEETLCAFRWPAARALGEHRKAPTKVRHSIKSSVEHVQAQAAGAIANVLLRGGTIAAAAEAAAQAVNACE